MASIHKHPNSKYYQCSFVDADERRVSKSTKQTNRSDAWRVALAMEDAATFRSLMTKAGIVPTVKLPKGEKGRQVYSLGFHSLRHSFNSDLANLGVSQEIRQKLIGHASEAVNDG